MTAGVPPPFLYCSVECSHSRLPVLFNVKKEKGEEVGGRLCAFFLVGERYVAEAASGGGSPSAAT